MEQKEPLSDDICNRNWDALLKAFHSITKTEDIKKRRQEYEDLKSFAKTKALTPRQMDGIIERCNYQISLIDNPDQKPFSNMLRKDERTLHLDKAQSNGKH